LHIVGVLVIAAALPFSVHSQQPTPASAEAPDSGVQQEAPAAHAVAPPKVSCTGNTLSVSANYSALGAILSAIQKCTGVQFDAPETAKSSLVFDEIGPGPSNDVLAALLTASGFDYIIGASAADPEKIEKIVLLTRAEEKDKGTPDMRGAPAGRRAFAQMREAARPHTPEEQSAAVADLERGNADAGSAAQTDRGETEATPATRKVDDSKAKPPGDGTTAEGQAPQAQQPGQEPATQAKANPDGTPANAEPPASSPTPPAPDTANTGRQQSPTEDRIANMQTLFEQRRQMIQQQQQHPTPP
jgi:hypothetical protein